MSFQRLSWLACVAAIVGAPAHGAMHAARLQRPDATPVAPDAARTINAQSGAAATPNFSGTWVLDAARSTAPQAARGRGRGGRGGGGDPGGLFGAAAPTGPVLIGQTDTDITIGSTTYKLDGSPTTSGLAGGIEARARWDGNALVIESSLSARGGAVSVRETRRLTDGGTTMTVDVVVSGARGQRETRQVFVKGGV